MENTTKSINTHITEYLDYYLAHSNPRFAVMLNGDWGIGKTHLLRTYLSKHSSETYAYVSLYGLNSFSEIDELIITDVHPVLDGSLVKAIESLGKSTLAYFNLQTDLGRKLLFNRYKRPIYIFDDLERCGLAPEKVLGYINQFVEHENKRVIIIANEQEFGKNEKYLRYREKLIGKTLSVSSPLNDALASFISDHETPHFKDFITPQSAQIKQLYKLSGISSLRILQQSLWDFERLFNTLSPAHQNHSGVLQHCLELFFPLSFAFKAGHLSEQDIQSRPQDSPLKKFARALADGEELTGFEKLEKQYAGFNLRDRILSNQDLANTLAKGLFKPAEIEHSITQSRFFREDSETALETLSNAFSRSEEKFQIALAKFNIEYQKFTFTSIDDILSSFSTRVWLAKQRFIEDTPDNVIEQGKAYLDHQYEKRRLSPLSEFHLTDRQYSFFNGRFHNYSRNDAESKECRAFFDYYKDLTGRIINDSYQQITEALLTDMRTDSDRYVWKISFASANSDDHVPTQALTTINPLAFTETLLSLPNEQQITVLTAFSRRYNFSTIDLGAERPWLYALKQQLESARRTRSHFDQQRLSSNIEHYLMPHIGNFYQPINN
ncbi:P-loop NTPase fold protein [Pseudomonas oryziphila]|uniref:KAP NTPase domain-containing protein n=2 Tax=Pseudomonas TaxID=286 RepID=A0A3Q8U2E3_9PSED|nr:P-loop NTPase fold protein [Pseudomonas oryziphila]AZL69518.1 hypothetical protein EJA05_18150 [Pseudomonas oryziphila]